MRTITRLCEIIPTLNDHVLGRREVIVLKRAADYLYLNQPMSTLVLFHLEQIRDGNKDLNRRYKADFQKTWSPYLREIITDVLANNRRITAWHRKMQRKNSRSRVRR